MKEKQLNVISYLRMLQYLTTEGFNVEPLDDTTNMTIGCRVKETDERYYFLNSEFESRCIAKEKIDLTPYNGNIKKMAEGFNMLIDQYVVPKGKKNRREV